MLLEELGPTTQNLRANYWFDSSIYAPNRINSALLRQTKTALVTAGISLPDPAREVVFPSGVPIDFVQGKPGYSGSVEIKPTSRRHEVQPDPEDKAHANQAEGNLSSDVAAVTGQSTTGPEAQENLLKSE